MRTAHKPWIYSGSTALLPYYPKYVHSFKDAIELNSNIEIFTIRL